MNRTSSGNTRDIGQIVRRGGYKFAGEPGESIDTFLERIEESWELAKLTEVEMLSALPELFIGVAATWVRSNRSVAQGDGSCRPSDGHSPRETGDAKLRPPSEGRRGPDGTHRWLRGAPF